MRHRVPNDVQEEHAFVVEAGEAGKRLDKFLSDRLADQGVSRSRISQWIRQERVRVAGVLCLQGKTKVLNGQNVVLLAPSLQSGIKPEVGPVEVVYNDPDVVVVNKAAGVTVHPGTGCESGTLVHHLAALYPELARFDGERPGVVHRLDKDTSGLLTVALNESARLALTRSFARREVDKEYLTLVHGRPEAEGTVDHPLGRDPQSKIRMAVVPRGGKEALTRFKRVWTSPDGRVSLLRVRILTGRTHQIRVHMAYLGFPLVGDALYGPQAQAAFQRSRPLLARLAKHHMLHAWRLAFPHPRSGRMVCCEQAMPKAMWRLVLGCGRRVQRIGLTGMPGCGKSALLSELSDRGVLTWSADQEVRALYAPGGDGADLLARRFGDEILDDSGGVDKKALLARMQSRPGLHREVEELIHPLVRHRLEAFWTQTGNLRLAVAEAPLLFEAGWSAAREFDVVVGVHCSRRVRRARLQASRGWSESMLSGLESWQWTPRAKLSRCQFIVPNDEDRHMLARRAEMLMELLRRRRLRQIRSLWQDLQVYRHSRAVLDP